MTEGSSGESHSGDEDASGAAPRAVTAAAESCSREEPRAESTAGAAERGEEPRGEAPRSTVIRSAADEAKRQARIAAAKAAYLRTVRNESGQSAGGSNDDRLLADRPPHWAPKSTL